MPFWCLHAHSEIISDEGEAPPTHVKFFSSRMGGKFFRVMNRNHEDPAMYDNITQVSNNALRFVSQLTQIAGHLFLLVGYPLADLYRFWGIALIRAT
jgi:hypothetical protein